MREQNYRRGGAWRKCVTYFWRNHNTPIFIDGWGLWVRLNKPWHVEDISGLATKGNDSRVYYGCNYMGLAEERSSNNNFVATISINTSLDDTQAQPTHINTSPYIMSSTHVNLTNHDFCNIYKTHNPLHMKNNIWNNKIIGFIRYNAPELI